ncbi:CoA:oxalate CoA-transferase [Nocardia sp. GAS34]|uniref:CoA transferase n=1 Tax=unclassified Nocardia TaxID=2637762 RepID=UPI003D2043E7
MTNTSTSGPPIDLFPSGTLARVTGTGPAAEVLREHLRAFGATLTEAADPGDSGSAATAMLDLGNGIRREVFVPWAGPIDEPALTNETTVQAICGVMHVNGRRIGAPRGISLDYCATTAGVLAMTGLLASLLVPAEHLRIDTSVAESALLAISQYLAAAGADDPEAVDLAPGGPPFVSADAIRFEIESLQPEPWAAFWTALGVEARTAGKGWRPFQFRYATATAPLPRALHAAVRSQRFSAIAQTAARTGVSVCRLYGAAEPGTPATDVLPAPWSIAASIDSTVQHRDSIASPSSPLGGVSVLEAGRRVQAPLAAHLLRLLGADVTRIEPPGGDPLREMPPYSGDLSARWLALNRGKRAAEFDIKSAADRARLRELAAEADVFLHNWAPGKAEELELSAQHLPPGLVYAYTSGWAGLDLEDAPPGTDFMVQARTGLAELVGPPDSPPAPSLMTLLDVLGGILGAEATVLGLLRRHSLGRGTAVQSSLLAAANTLRRHGISTTPLALRQPFRLDSRWVVSAPDALVPVTDDPAQLLTNPRFATVLGRDDHGCPALTTPWRMS